MTHRRTAVGMAAFVAAIVVTVVVAAVIFAVTPFSITVTKTEVTTSTMTIVSTSLVASTNTSTQCVQTGIHGTLYIRVISDSTNQPVSGANVSATITNYCTPNYQVALGLTNSTGYTNGWTWTGGYIVSVAYAGTDYTFPAQTSQAVSLVTLSIPSGLAVEKAIACYGLGCGLVNYSNTTTVTASSSSISTTSSVSGSSCSGSPPGGNCPGTFS